MFYENLKKICASRNTTPTTVLKALGLSSGNTGRWKAGALPNVDIAYRIAQYLGVSIECLITGKEMTAADAPIDPEWVEIITHIPGDHQDMCKDFLRTHMVILEKYADRKRA